MRGYYGTILAILAAGLFILAWSFPAAAQTLEVKGGYVSTDEGTGYVIGGGLVVQRSATTETVFGVEYFQTSDVVGIEEARVTAWPITLTNKVLYRGSPFYYGTGIGVYPVTEEIFQDDILVARGSATNIGYHLVAGLEFGNSARIEGKYFQGGTAATGYSLTFNMVF